MRVSYHLYLELGISFHPMQESYHEFGYLVTPHSWMKALWEKLSFFNVKVVLADVSPHFPQEDDQFIMKVLMQAGYTGETLR